MSNFKQKLAMKQDIEAEIKRVNASLEKFINIPSLQQSVGDARSRLNNLIATYGNEGNLPAGRQSDLIGLKAALKDKQATLDTVLAQERTLRQELAALKEQRAAIDLCVNEEEVLALQKELAALDAEAADLAAAIQAQTGKGAEGKTLPLMDLEARRAELLADAALGKDVKQKLAAITKEMTAAGKQIEGALDSELALSALEARLSACRARRAELLDVHRAAVAGYLTARAALAAEEYREAAEDLGACVARMVALDKLLDRFDTAGDSPRTIGIDLAWLSLPGVKGQDPVFRTEDIDLPAVIATESTVIRATGIDLPA